jgi:hypothetical protein
MADLLAEVEQYMIAKGVVNILYRDYMPDTPVACAAVYEYSGYVPEVQIAGAYRPIQFVTRDTSATVSRKLAYDLYHALITDDGVLYLNDQRWCVIELKQTPFKLKQDQAGRILYVFNAALVTYID